MAVKRADVGLRVWLQWVLASAVGLGAGAVLSGAMRMVAKPDRRIFADACSRLGVPADRVLHVGDTLADDYFGSEASGLLAVLVDRDPGPTPRAARVIHTLDELPAMLRPLVLPWLVRC